MKITFIGGGNMGEAIIAALLLKKVVTPEEINASDIMPERIEYLYEKFGVNTTSNNITAVREAEVVVLAVKPQTLRVVMDGLKGKLKATQTVLSIIAGARIATVRQGLGIRKIVRAMPNTPAQIGEGITVWKATPEVTKTQKGMVRAILKVMGQEIEVDDEVLLDMATAVSGSGPAYIYYFIESLVEAAVKLGFSGESAERLVQQTVTGSVHLMQKSGKKPTELRKAVTSPGGTTAAAIAYFEKHGLPELVAGAVEAAYTRAKEIGS